MYVCKSAFAGGGGEREGGEKKQSESEMLEPQCVWLCTCVSRCVRVGGEKEKNDRKRETEIERSCVCARARKRESERERERERDDSAAVCLVMYVCE